MTELVDVADLKSAAARHEGSSPSFRTKQATVAQWIEQQPSKLWVAGSIPASRAINSYGCSNSPFSSSGRATDL